MCFDRVTPLLPFIAKKCPPKWRQTGVFPFTTQKKGRESKTTKKQKGEEKKKTALSHPTKQNKKTASEPQKKRRDGCWPVPLCPAALPFGSATLGAFAAALAAQALGCSGPVASSPEKRVGKLPCGPWANPRTRYLQWRPELWQKGPSAEPITQPSSSSNSEANGFSGTPKTKRAAMGARQGKDSPCVFFFCVFSLFFCLTGFWE